MKKLQNDYTTPEQSKRLLELGVPADSADCIWYNPYYEGDCPELAEISVWKGEYPQRIDKYTFPCWSGMRLIDIIEKSWDSNAQIICDPIGQDNKISYMVDTIQYFAAHSMLDFSKLEE